ncbi:MAG: biotin transporter BioY [Acutalibacteraceae bacterium]|jgi:biotin transport system substrate-specific component
MSDKRIFNITFAALFTALVCVMSQISFQTPTVPVTLQTFGVALCGYTLRPKWALSSIAAYIAIGAFGLPVFSSFRGGMQVIAGPTGGFIIGFLFLALGCSCFSLHEKRMVAIISGTVGMLICHLLGATQYSIVTGNSFLTALLTASLPFLIKDVLSVTAAYFLSVYILKLFNKLKI